VNETVSTAGRGDGMIERKRAPVFVIGCPRSGTNFLYDCLLSSGGFAIFRGRLPIHQVLIPRFGKLDRLENRKKIVSVFLRSEGFRRSGLDGVQVTAKLLEACRNGGDFIRIVMDEIAQEQQVGRWALYDPEMLVRIATIKKEIPEALFVHIIRDGRDIALSLRKLGGFNPLPWTDSARSLEEIALYWEWLVQKGRSYGRQIVNDYAEVHFEELIGNPRVALKELSQFLDHDLDYDRIQVASLGTLGKSNSSFRGDKSDGGLNPVQRWKQKLSKDQIAALEWQVGNTLKATGYELSVSENAWTPGIREHFLRAVYQPFLDGKLWFKANTPLGRVSSLSKLELKD
jgi:hypothetical protein